MQAVRATGTKIEMSLAKSLFAKGLRYRKNDKTVYGKPDLTFKKYKIAIFVDGEFWHGKNWETRKYDHKSNKDFWVAKIERNIQRDKEVNDKQKRDIVSKNCLFNLNQYLNNIGRFMEEKSIERVEVYLGELSSQLKKLDQPISKADKQNFEMFLKEVEKIENGIQSNLLHYKAYADGIILLDCLTLKVNLL